MVRHAGVVPTARLAEAPLYAPAGSAARLFGKPAELVFIPYYAWANRGQHAMQVWVPAAP